MKMRAASFPVCCWARVGLVLQRGFLAGAIVLWAGCGAQMEQAPPESAALREPLTSEPQEAAAAPSGQGESEAHKQGKEEVEESAGMASNRGFSAKAVRKVAEPPAKVSSGSTPAPEPVIVPAPAPAPPDSEPLSKDFHKVEVFYATDRQPLSMAGASNSYGKERNREGPMEYGRTEVSIPLHHSMGIIERPKWYKLEFTEDPKKHVVILRLEKMAAGTFFGRVSETASGRALREGLLFVHGFNVPFDQAVRRTAQISFDLDFGGVALTYSWPSQGELTGYVIDEGNAEWSIPHLAQFLVDLQEKTHLDKIHVIAHSMGTRILSQALVRARDDGFRLDLNNVILAAPDIDADVFKEQILPKIRGSVKRLTMYASSEDAALKASEKVHGYSRLGLSGDRLLVLEGMDTVDASQIDTSLLGHNYYGSQKLVVEDLLELIIQGLAPSQRKLVPGKVGEWGFMRGATQ